MALALISPLEPQLQRYFLLCEQYKCAPNPAVTLSLKYPGVTFIAPDKPFCPSELIPLCEVLKTDTTVQSLDFRRCKIGSSGCYALKMLLEHNSTLRQLNLPYNDIGEHGAQALAEGLARNSTLERLYLQGNRVGRHGSAAFAQVFRSTGSLKHVDLTNNDIGSEGVTTLAAAINDRFRHRKAAKQAARRAGVFHGDGALKVKDIELLLDGNLVREEVTSSLLHGTGLILAVCGALPLVRAAQQSNDSRHLWGVLVYLITLLGMYASATLGHSFFKFHRTAYVFKLIDHSAIYVLIAGTYTPFMLVNLRNKFAGSLMLVSIWTLALIGVLLSVFLAGKYRQWRMQIACLIGWCALLSYRSVLQCIDQGGVILLAVGGLVYSLGGYMYVRNNPSNHFAYVCALIGTALHYFAVYFYVHPSECTDAMDILPEWLFQWILFKF